MSVAFAANTEYAAKTESKQIKTVSPLCTTDWLLWRYPFSI